jgi:ubiquinone/menaquinone biosynthesis C-methylase UbiE
MLSILQAYNSRRLENSMSLEYQKKTMEFYDAVAEEFDKTRIKPDPFLEMLAAKNFFKSSRFILDNGCGNCRNLTLFSEKNVLIAGDVSRKMLKQCRKNKSGLNIHHLQYVLTHLPFRNDVFDGIVCIAAIHHLKKNDVVKAMLEMKNVLKDKGWLLVSSWSNKILRSKRFSKKVEKTDDYFLIKWGKYKRFYFLMDAKMLRGLCEEAGFKNTVALEHGMNSYILIEGGSESY